jgi:hypothetical protein
MCWQWSWVSRYNGPMVQSMAADTTTTTTTTMTTTTTISISNHRETAACHRHEVVPVLHGCHAAVPRCLSAHLIHSFARPYIGPSALPPGLAASASALIGATKASFGHGFARAIGSLSNRRASAFVVVLRLACCRHVRWSGETQALQTVRRGLYRQRHTRYLPHQSQLDSMLDLQLSHPERTASTCRATHLGVCSLLQGQQRPSLDCLKPDMPALSDH